MLEDVCRNAEILRDEAEDILLKRGLYDILADYGTVEAIGSFSLNLMAWRDLDLCVVTDPAIPAERFFQAGARIVEKFPVHRMRFQNERLAQTEGPPQSLCWAVYLGDERQGAWKFDIWAVTSEQFTTGFGAYRDRMAARLTAETRRIILEIKTQVWAKPGYRGSYTSHDIYHAVLEAGVTDPSGFNAYLLATKGYRHLWATKGYGSSQAW